MCVKVCVCTRYVGVTGVCVCVKWSVCVCNSFVSEGVSVCDRCVCVTAVSVCVKRCV